MTAPHTVTASFTLQTETITASAREWWNDRSNRLSECQLRTNQTFTVTPNAGYTQTLKVDGTAVTLTSNAYTLTDVTAPHTVTASFTLQTETITASAGSGGTINPTGSMSVNYGANQTFTVTPNAGYTQL